VLSGLDLNSSISLEERRGIIIRLEQPWLTGGGVPSLESDWITPGRQGEGMPSSGLDYNSPGRHGEVRGTVSCGLDLNCPVRHEEGPGIMIRLERPRLDGGDGPSLESYWRSSCGQTEGVPSIRIRLEHSS
jgi:hypothetical protein